MNDTQKFQQSSQRPPAPPPPTPKRLKPRLFWVLIPASLWIVHHLVKNAVWSISWNKILALGVHDKRLFTQLFVLMTLATVVIVVLKNLRKK